MRIGFRTPINFPLADVLTLSGKIADGEFDQFFIEQFS